jgi:hypothetical protein
MACRHFLESLQRTKVHVKTLTRPTDREDVFFIRPSIFVRCNFSCSGLWFYPPRFMSVCSFVRLFIGTDTNCNFPAVRSPIELKLGGDLGLVSQISVHVLVSRFYYFLIVNKQKKIKNANSWFYKTCVFSTVPSPIDLKLGGDIQKSTRKSVVCCFVYIIVCLHFVNINKETTLYGGCLHPSLTHNVVKPVFLIHSLFMFYGYKQTSQFGVILKNAQTSSIWVSNERSRPGE